MKVVVELETYEEIERAGRWLQWLNPALVKIDVSKQFENIKKFLNFIDQEATAVENITIPNREERNAR